VSSVLVDVRALPVAAHGNVIVVWSSASNPSITALDVDGRALQPYTPRRCV